MSLKLSAKAAPVLFLIRASVWTAGVYFPYFYSLGFPNREIQRLVAALQGQQLARPELSSVVQGIMNSTGHLKRAIRIAAFYSAEYKVRQPHSLKQTQFSYLAWFEKRPRPTILVVNLKELQGDTLEFKIFETSPTAIVRVGLLPLFAMAFSFRWYRKRHVWFAEKQENQAGATTQ